MNAKVAEKIYHIYAKDECLFHSLREEEFYVTWSALQKLVEVLHSNYKKEDLSYEELLLNKEMSINSSY